MKGSLLNLLCVIIICATGTLCVLIHSEYNRYRFSGTPRAVAVYKLDKRTGNVWFIRLSKATLVTGDEINYDDIDWDNAVLPNKENPSKPVKGMDSTLEEVKPDPSSTPEWEFSDEPTK